MSKRLVKETITIEFWAEKNETIENLFEYIQKQCKKIKVDLEDYSCKETETGYDVKWFCTDEAYCEYYAGNYYEPDDYDYSNLLDEDDVSRWVSDFVKSANLIMDEDIADVCVSSEVETIYD